VPPRPPGAWVVTKLGPAAGAGGAGGGVPALFLGGRGPAWRTGKSVLAHAGAPGVATQTASGGCGTPPWRTWRTLPTSTRAPAHTNAPRRGNSPNAQKRPRRGKLPNAKNASYFGTGAPSAPEGDFAALGGCETRRTGPSPSAPAVRQRAPGGAPRRLAEVRASPNLRSDQHQHRHERQAQGEERPKHVLLWRVCPVCTCASLGPQQRARRLA
jgi:hypothetical protein